MKYIFTLLIVSVIFLQLAIATNGVPEPAYHAKKTAVKPVIDGKVDSIWNIADWAPIDQLWIGNPTTADDYTGSYKAIWTSDRLFVLMKFIRSQINDNYTGAPPCYGEMYNYECAEIFIDENHSGGQYYQTYKAFAYHMMTNGHACAPGPSGWDDRTSDLTLVFDSAGNNTYYWEIELKVFDETYRPGSNNVPETLTAGKHMGFSIGYNTNDGGSTRKNMFGSHYISGTDKNVSYRDASQLGNMYLDDSIRTPETSLLPLKNKGNYLTVYPNPATTEINVKLDNNNSGKCMLHIYNILGKDILNTDFVKSKGIIEKQINLADLRSGVYFLKLSSGNENYIQKIYIQ
jgi:hypothetical protein